MSRKGPEANVENSVIGMAEKAGWTAMKVQFISRRGAPDRLFVRDGQAVWIEFKKAAADATTQQAKVHRLLRFGGHRVEVCRTIADGVRVLGL